MIKVNILGGYQTKFGELWGVSINDLSREAVFGVLKNARVEAKDIDIIFVASKLTGETTGQSHLGSLVAEILGINVPSFRVEAACASGGLATTLGYESVKTGRFKTALVIGVEKMTDVSTPKITKFLMQAGDSEKESSSGVTFPGIYAMMARSLHRKIQTGEDEAFGNFSQKSLSWKIKSISSFSKRN